MKRVVITGPESTGKSTLARQLAEHFNCIWVEEYARTYIDELDRPYIETDLLRIAKGQIKAEEKVLQADIPHLICDTDLLTIEIWSDIRFGRCDPWITEQIKTRAYDLYFLCGTDIPWEYDPQRESKEDRWFLYEVYRERLIALGKRFVELKGNEQERFMKALAFFKVK